MDRRGAGVVGPAVDRFLAALPVVAVAPVVDEVGEERRVGARSPGAVVGDGLSLK